MTLTVTLTLTDIVTVIFYAHFVDTHKRLYRNNKINFCGGAVAEFVFGPVFPVFRLFTRFMTRIQ